MENILKLSVFLVVCMFLSCSNTGKTNTSARKQAENTADKWNIVQKGTQCAVNQESQVLIKTVDDLQAEWNRAFAGMDMKPEMPQVDFTKSWVVAAYMGEKNKGGFEIGIRSVQTENDSLIVIIRHIIPGPNCMSSMAIEYPFLIAVIGQSPALKAGFKIADEIKECN